MFAVATPEFHRQVPGILITPIENGFLIQITKDPVALRSRMFPSGIPEGAIFRAGPEFQDEIEKMVIHLVAKDWNEVKQILEENKKLIEKPDPKIKPLKPFNGQHGQA